MKSRLLFRMLWLLACVAFVCVGEHASPAVGDITVSVKPESPRGLLSVYNGHTRDTLRDSNALEHPRGEAILSDAQHVSRVCNTRPQRLQPTFGGRVKWTGAGERGLSAYRSLSTTLKHAFAGWHRPTLPLRPGASCDYYVIALRHILC